MDSLTGARIADFDVSEITALGPDVDQSDVCDLRLPDGQILAVLTTGSRLVVWNYRTGTLVKALRWSGHLTSFSMDTPFYVFVQGNEVTAGDANSGVEMAWFPCPNGFAGYTGLISNAVGPYWAGCLRNQIFHFTLEGGTSASDGHDSASRGVLA